MVSLLSAFSDKQKAVLSKSHGNFDVGDTVSVKYKIADDKGGERFQLIEGLCIAIRNKGLGSSFLLRRTAHGVSAEMKFMKYSPLIAAITLVRKGKVRRAKLYYMRSRSGKMARVKQDMHYVGGVQVS